MRRRPLFWLAVSLACFAAALYFWRLGDRWAARRSTPDSAPTSPPPSSVTGRSSATHPGAAPFQLLTVAGNLNAPQLTAATNSSRANRFAHRLSNTTQSVGALARSSKAILLQNALLDTAKGGTLPIPEHLRAKGDPGSYIVQSRAGLNDTFRALIGVAGGSIISYIPNNAYLVRISAAGARQLAASPQAQAVLPYEPYYKLSPSLLGVAVEQTPLPEDARLNVLLFADARDTTVEGLKNLGVNVLHEDRSQIGPLLQVQAPASTLAAVAGLPGVRVVEMAHARVSANDLSRVQVAVPDSSFFGTVTPTQVTNNYLGLSGSNVLVNVNDSGVDGGHPDLSNRVYAAQPGWLVDSNGHGTHVIGTIIGNGSMSAFVTNAGGSVMPTVPGQFQGMARAASAFVLGVAMGGRDRAAAGAPMISDAYLQTNAAQAGLYITNAPAGTVTNILISNNSWVYGGDFTYDLAAACYDAAVRDSLPTVPGPQPLLYVFAAGNAGGGDDNGLSGNPDSIESPGTAKNVLTVGAIEQPRNITNIVTIPAADVCTTGDTNVTTYMPWAGMTDTNNQVVSFSSRGNVGIGYEGDAGRFKPDVVAPGSFVISTRSAQWDPTGYYNPTNYHGRVITNLTVTTNGLWNDLIPVPCNALEVDIRVFGVKPNVDLPIYLGYTDSPTTNVFDFLGTNSITMPPDGNFPAVLGGTLFYGVGDPTNVPVVFSVVTTTVTTNDLGDYYLVLSNLNYSLGLSNQWFYRYESGTSMSAADASGVLALMQEQVQQRLGVTNPSPALMKALVINGARSVSGAYDFEVTNSINYQGWGLINLTNSLPGGLTNAFNPAVPGPIKVFDQNLTNALATGDSRTYKLTLDPAACNYPLRITLVWTDPAGDPAASYKLVNDLDLVVTNADTTNVSSVYFGNDIPAGSDFNPPRDPSVTTNADVVNNVETVYLNSPLATNYVITVAARHVNVNAVSLHTNNVVQDFALVISSGNGEVANALTITSGTSASANTINFTAATNTFSSPTNVTGSLLMHQHVGASSPLLGTNQILAPGGDGVITLGVSNQWHFYAFTNIFSFPYAAFATLIPPELSVPRMGVFEGSVDNATRAEADIDLYVSTDPALLSLDSVAVSNAYKSLTRGGTETIILSNANVSAQEVFYVGVKSEDQMAAEYAMLGVFSPIPFSTTSQGDEIPIPLVGLPVAIPDGIPQRPGVTYIPFLAQSSFKLRRVVVTDLTIAHQRFGDLVSDLGHDTAEAVLLSHSFPLNPPVFPNPYSYIFEDNGQGDITGSRHTDGWPGLGLTNFIGKIAAGMWLLSVADNAMDHTGMVEQASILLQPSLTSGGGTSHICVEPYSWFYDFIDVPPDATNLTVCIENNNAPVDLYLRFGDFPTTNNFDRGLTNIAPPGDCITMTPYDLPPLTPLQPGRYFIGVYNPNGSEQCMDLFVRLLRSPIAPSSFVTNGGPVTIQDDAVTYAYITNSVPFNLLVSGLDVGLRIDDPRVSDLAITLISPNGTRILLFEDRGGLTTNGLGSVSYTNYFLAPFYTNNFDDVPSGWYAPSAVFDGWNVLSNMVTLEPDWTCLCDSNHVLVLRDGIVSNTLPTVLPPATNPMPYQLSFRVNHAPYLIGTVGWWPLDGDAQDIFGLHDGLLCCDTTFSTGEVAQAYFGDGVRTSVLVPGCPDLDVGQGRGFSIEGWINPNSMTTGAVVMADGFENAPEIPAPFAAGSIVSGWLVEASDVDVCYPGAGFSGLPDSGRHCLDLSGHQAGAISRSFDTIPKRSYTLSFACSKNPGTSQAQATLSMTGQPDLPLSYNLPNTVSNLNWTHTSILFTASSPITKLKLTSLTPGFAGMFLDSFTVKEYAAPNRGPFTVSVPASSPWFDTGIDVPAGSHVLITASGTVRYGPMAPQTTNPDGGNYDGQTRIAGCVYPNAMALGLIGKIGGSTAVGTGTSVPEGWLDHGDGFVGTTYDQVMTTSGRLFLGFNDQTTLFYDNSGAFSATIRIVDPSVPAPLVEWNSATNFFPQGVQFWLSGLPGTNLPGALCANVWDTNLTPHIMATVTNTITNGGWQHVALTYETSTHLGRIYTNGQLAVAQVLSFTNFVPQTSGDLFFGYHPDVPINIVSYAGGLDEIGLYDRQLSDCEVWAIYHAGSRGKYGTNVLLCPVATTVQLPSLGLSTNFINGTNWWVTGPQWETNIILFQVPTNTWPTNTPIIVRPMDPVYPTNLSAALDDFVLTGLTNLIVNGFLHFTEDTNLALIPIKFAPTPYMGTNFQATPIFTNDFESARPGLYPTGTNIPGNILPGGGVTSDWQVVQGPVTVLTNADFDVMGTNGKYVALAAGTIQSTLPTLAGHRYQLSYTVRGPCAVGWWNGDLEPLSGRARDLIGGNHGAFFNGATNVTRPALSMVGNTALDFFGGTLTNGWTNKIELSDPPNLRLTNSFTIEAWIKPIEQTNGDFTLEKVEQLFFRGDSRNCFDPYYLGLEQTGPDTFDIIFHVENGAPNDCGVLLETDGTRGPVPRAGIWQHLAAVFEANVLWTNNPPWPTNQLRLYLDGQQLTNVFLEDPSGRGPFLDTSFTAQAPFANLDPAYSPGVAIGNDSRYEAGEPYRGFIDELTVYARALTGPEIAAIANNGRAGKADLSQPPAQSLAEVSVLLDGVEVDVGHGDNSSWTSRTVEFYAASNTTQLTLQSLLPGTLVDGVILTEIPPELHYLPEETLAALNGESANGVWTLEIWDTRAGGNSATNAVLLSWQLNFRLTPSAPLPVIFLQHGIPYSGSLPANGVQYFVVNVPQWALYATNVLLNASLPVGVLFDNTNQVPSATTNALFWPPVNSGLTNLTTNTLATYHIDPGQPYYLAITNPNPFAAAFSYGVWFDITPLTNCQYLTNLVVGPAGIPRYFQFDVPTNAVPPDLPQVVSFWLTGARSNLTVVLSEHLPLPDLDYHDYISQQPCTNDEIVMVLTNSTPWPLVTNRWYVGVFNTRETNVSFNVEACYQTNAPTAIALTNRVPFFAPRPSPFAAPPGPPRWLFYTFQITNIVNGVLFELYDLTGQADLLLQRDVPPGMAAYFADSFRLGTNAEQIVLRPTYEFPDLRGNWYLGVYNHEATNSVGYTIRAALPDTNGLLISGLPIRLAAPVRLPQGVLLQWNAVAGERYFVWFTPTLSPPAWTLIGVVVASTPCATFVVPGSPSGFFRVSQTATPPPGVLILKIQLWPGDLIRLSWPMVYSGYTLQSAPSPAGPWTNVNLPVTVEGTDFVVYDTIGAVPKFYRLTQ